MEKKYVMEYYFFEGRYKKFPYNKVRKMKNKEEFKLKRRKIVIMFSENFQKNERKQISQFIEEELCKQNRKIKETIIEVSMLYDVKISYRIKCGKKLILFIRTP